MSLRPQVNRNPIINKSKEDPALVTSIYNAITLSNITMDSRGVYRCTADIGNGEMGNKKHASAKVTIYGGSLC